MNRFAKLSAALLLSAAASAPAWAAPEVYTVDGTHTFPRFSYSHFGLSMQTSGFNSTTGTSNSQFELKEERAQAVAPLSGPRS